MRVPYLLIFFGKLFVSVLIKADTKTFDKIAVEALIRQWAPLVWLAPEEKFLPLNVEEFLEHVFLTVPGNTTMKQSIKLPYGLDSEKYYLVTKKNLGGATVKNAISGNNGHPNIHTCIYNYKLIEEKCYERNDFVKLQINFQQNVILDVTVAKNTLKKLINNAPLMTKGFLFGPSFSNAFITSLAKWDLLYALMDDGSSFLYGKNPAEHKVSVYTLVTACSPNLSYRVTDSNSLTNTINTIYRPSELYPHFHVVFWIFYPYNEGKEVCLLGKVPTPLLFSSCIGQRKIIGNHVGDWEHISLSFSGKPYPDKLYVSVHDAGVYYKYEPISNLFKYEKQVTRKGILQRPQFPPVVRRQKGHPVLFSAYGSHGMWSAPGEHYYVRVPRLIDRNGYGTIWETWKSLQIFHLDRDKLPAWIMFKGKWGNPQSNCFLFKKLGICEYSDGPMGILERKQDFYCIEKA